MPRARGVAAHPTVMKAEEIHALTTFLEVHDPCLGRLELKAKLGQDRRQRSEGAFGLLSAVAERQQIVRVADQHAGTAVRPLPVEPVQVDVGQAGRDDGSHAKGNLGHWGLWGWGLCAGW